MIFGSVSASLSIAPVHGKQPSERIRTLICSTFSPGKSFMPSCTSVIAPPRITIGLASAKYSGTIGIFSA